MKVLSRRLPGSLAPNRLTVARERVGEVPWDLTVTNPTRCGLEAPAGILEALADPRGLVYEPEPRGPLAGRRAAAATFADWGVQLDPGRLVLTASTSEAYGFLFKLLADPGDVVLAPTPSYPLLEPLARLEGVELATNPLDPEDGWRPDPAAVLDAAPDRTRAVVVVHPNNPTGSMTAPDRAAELARACALRGWALIADEVFLPFPLAPAHPSHLHTFAARDECLTFTLGGLSKRCGLPQMKLAWIAVGGPDAHVAAALEALDHVADAYLSVSTPVALAASRLLELGRTTAEAIRARCRTNLGRLEEIAAAAPALTVPPPEGGWSALVRIPALIDEEELALELLETDGVAVSPGFLFDLPRDRYLVLSLLTEPGILAEGVARLAARVARVVEG